MSTSISPTTTDPRMLAMRWSLRAAALSGAIALVVIIIQFIHYRPAPGAGPGLAGLRVEFWHQLHFPLLGLLPLTLLWIIAGALLLAIRSGLHHSRRFTPILGFLLAPAMLLLPGNTVLAAWIDTDYSWITMIFLALPVLTWAATSIMVMIRLVPIHSTTKGHRQDPWLLAAPWSQLAAVVNILIGSSLIIIALTNRSPLSTRLEICFLAVVWLTVGALLLLVRRGLNRSRRSARLLGFVLAPTASLLVPVTLFFGFLLTFTTGAGDAIINFLTIPMLCWIATLIVLIVRLAQIRSTSPNHSQDTET